MRSGQESPLEQRHEGKEQASQVYVGRAFRAEGKAHARALVGVLAGQ